MQTGAASSGTEFALVDAFVFARAFSGNPAGVVLLDDLFDDAWMQGIANGLAQTGTAFSHLGGRAGERDVLAVLAFGSDVQDVDLDLQAVAALPTGGLTVTAERDDRGVVQRYSAPSYGIPEDPVTGSAHRTVGPYWREQIGPALSAEQVSRRGGESTVLTTDDGRVLLGGRARTSAAGLLL